MSDDGLTLPELLVSLMVLAILGWLGCISGAETLAHQRVENASRTLAQGIERARSSALRNNTPCGMSLTSSGWGPPQSGTLAPCLPDVTPLVQTGYGSGVLNVKHNMPAELRFSSNGLVLDGGTVVFSLRGTSLRRCLVMALPLGVVRLGRYGADPTTAPDSSACLPDSSL
jgi:prepilin-type N-terminal cleavage/methylation domain-containing protein